MLKRGLHRLISSGLHADLPEDMKVAIQVANADVLLTIATLLFYSGEAFFGPASPLAIIHPTGLLVSILGFYLIRKRFYDTGRILIHLNGLVMIFCPADIYSGQSGFEFYYFISITIPFVTFAFSEYRKGLVLSAIAGALLVFQEYAGQGLIFETVPTPPNMRSDATIIVMIYLTAIFAVARWQLSISRKTLAKEQENVIAKTNLITLGEMSAGIAHEINNPLQSLTLEIELLKRELEKEKLQGKRVPSLLTTMSETSLRLGKMIKGLKDLSRDFSPESPELFEVDRAVREVVASFNDRFQELNVSVDVFGTNGIMIKGNISQFNQVLMNLISNSIDAIAEEGERRIWINYERSGSNLVLSITDSGRPISDAVSDKMMKPFFSTKAPSKSQGLGLPVASSIVGRFGGRLIYDSGFNKTRFVIEYPLP